jgi:hypothetical protein
VASGKRRAEQDEERRINILLEQVAYFICVLLLGNVWDYENWSGLISVSCVYFLHKCSHFCYSRLLQCETIVLLII